MDDKSLSERLRRIKQIKAVSGLACNAGLAVAAAGAGRWFFEGADGYAILWFLAGAIAIMVGVKALTMLEAEI